MSVGIIKIKKSIVKILERFPKDEISLGVLRNKLRNIYIEDVDQALEDLIKDGFVFVTSSKHKFNGSVTYKFSLTSKPKSKMGESNVDFSKYVK